MSRKTEFDNILEHLLFTKKRRKKIDRHWQIFDVCKKIALDLFNNLKNIIFLSDIFERNTLKKIKWNTWNNCKCNVLKHKLLLNCKYCSSLSLIWFNKFALIWETFSSWKVWCSIIEWFRPFSQFFFNERKRIFNHSHFQKVFLHSIKTSVRLFF